MYKFSELTEKKKDGLIREFGEILSCSCDGVQVPIPDMLSFTHDGVELLVYNLPVYKCLDRDCKEESYPLGSLVKACERAKELYEDKKQKEFDFNTMFDE